MASIQRQLNLYGFRCTNRIDEKGVFHHPSFVRGQYDLVRNIRRKKTWPTKRKPKGDSAAEAASSSTNASTSSTVTAASSSVSTTSSKASSSSSSGSSSGSSRAHKAAVGRSESVKQQAANHFASSVSPVDDVMLANCLDSNSNICEQNYNGCSPLAALNGYISPLSQLLASDEYLLDFFDDKSIDNMMMIGTGLEAGDFDQSLINLFANEMFPEEL
jgi:hypothetical protein